MRLCHALIAAATVLPAGSYAQQASTARLSGVVRNVAVEPLVGAAVRVEDSSLGSLTDSRGVYRIAGVAIGRRVLVVAQLGFRTARRELEVSGNLTVDFRLQESAVRVDDVVVTATGTAQRQMESTASVGVVTGPELRESRATC